ncbi:MAG: SpoIIIAH-like family protein [Firmicutes bacterium]|nr:SpoIIIAH-like family protein [Bacillota bacterium]
MINKQSIWFLTLFSLILVLSVYYITMPNELLITNNSNQANQETINETSEEQAVIKESELLTALRVEAEEERTEEINALNETLNNKEASTEDKNNAFEKLKDLNSLKGKEQLLEKKIKENFKVDSFVKIDNNNQIRVVVSSSDHSTELANNIMRSIQEDFDTKMYISVKFQS